ncbi:transcriptional adapter ADA2-like isoform X2 [Apium graveolens]|uniref:transcriptional adapter ADA2-like isoform X2 n=1 Tax=Apium graveolens TaxID=4045 RepID=UPI003D7B519C
MGRSRAIPNPADDDPSQSRSKRKRTASNVENLESARTGQGTIEGKKALYHCNYCNKDISGKIRIKCAMCSDFDLCVECFSVGAEVYPHKSNHPYRVMDNLSFPLICPDWNADEEILLLEGIEMYGLGNWNEVAEHVGTKSRSQCVDHYNTIYMNSLCFPLPDMSHVMGKNREELLAMAREQGEVKKGLPVPGELTVKEESSFPARVKVEDQSRDILGRSLSSLVPEVGTGAASSNGKSSTGGVKRASSIVQSKVDSDGPKIEDRSVGEKKPRISGDEGPTLTELSGYNSKRQEFEIEYDNDAEQLLADMEFKDTDTDAEREIKLRILRIYSKRLDERKRRKDFILDRNLLYPDPFEKDLSPEEKEICQQFRVFMRFHMKEEHVDFLRVMIEEHRIRKRIQYLKNFCRKLGLLAAAHMSRQRGLLSRSAREKLKNMHARPRRLLKLGQVVNSCRGLTISKENLTTVPGEVLLGQVLMSGMSMGFQELSYCLNLRDGCALRSGSSLHIILRCWRPCQ